MKKKIFSIMLALALVLSFSLVTAVPVGAQVTEREFLDQTRLAAAGNGTAEWVTTLPGDAEVYNGYFAARMAVPADGDIANIVHMGIQGDSPLLLSQITTAKFWEYLVSAGGSWDGSAAIILFLNEPGTDPPAEGTNPPEWGNVEDGLTFHSYGDAALVDEWSIRDLSNVDQDWQGYADSIGDTTVEPLSYWTDTWENADWEVCFISVCVGSGDWAGYEGYIDDFIVEWTSSEYEDIYLTDPRVVNVTQNTGHNYIQNAIDEALADDTINVAAGTYNERVNINKSLTLEGANAGIPGSGTRGPESIINPQWLEIFDGDTGKDFGVLIYEADTIATFDGFTVENYHRVGILAGSYGLNQEEYPNPSVVHILNNIISEPIGQHNNNCIQVGFGTTGTIIGNEVFGAVLESPDYSGSGILVSCSSGVLVSSNYVHDCEGGIQIMGWPVSGLMGPAVSNVIEYNLAVGNVSGIVAQQNAIGTIIRYNDALNNASGIVSVGYITWDNYLPSGTQIHYNNIVGNVNYGVRSYAWDGEPDDGEQVDALYNWWGDATGPDHATRNTNAQGNAVSDNVDFSPWLYEPQENFVSDAPCYAGSVVVLNEATLVGTASYAGGWNSFSTPVTLDSSANTWGELLALTAGSDLSILRAQRFNPATQLWVPVVMNNMLVGSNYAIKPGEGFFIQVEIEGSLPILCNTGATSPPMTNLLAGWNLVGLSNLTSMFVADALPGISYSVVLSASPPNALAWSVPPSTAGNTMMDIGEAYWVAMGGPGILFGFTTTPVADDMTWDLNQ